MRDSMGWVTDHVIVEWLDVELPKVETRRADLLGLASDGTLVHMEL